MSKARADLVSLVHAQQYQKQQGKSTRARSLRSDRAEWTFGRYVATEPWLELGHYVAEHSDPFRALVR
ncbi:hypothetical protein F2Q69_00022721 [Brassica cretica]|uniref:Uncharacterized protein n=1 Tax=Brassica cretica TaxID=69181 RepID=A0A8S9Q7M7_BRACR|nr:hypothetical protein F2Q69_00022721 [Brassica cretica]